MVQSREESERHPARSVCSGAALSLRLRDCREKNGRNWEVSRKRGRRGEKKEEGGKEKKRETEQAVLVFCHTPSGIRCYL